MKSETAYTQDWVSDHTDDWEKWLGHLRGVKARGLEIGSFEGRSAAWFMENILTHPESTLTCIDKWKWRPESLSRFQNNTRPYIERMNVHQGRSTDMLQHPTMGSFDFAYVDGNHDSRYVLADGVMALTKMLRGGVMIFDDYLAREKGNIGAKEAINAFCEIYARHLDVLHVGEQVAVRIKEKFPEE